MELGYNLRLTLVIINMVSVMTSAAHAPVTLFVALFTAQFLFVYYVVNLDRMLGVVGVMACYTGVMVAGLGRVDGLWPMAVTGSILMLIDALDLVEE